MTATAYAPADTAPLMPRTQTRAPVRRVLRILSGRLAGKAFPLDGRDRLGIGHGLANDVVLRGAGTRDCAVEINLSGDSANLSVLTGQVDYLGRTLEAGDQAILPPYLPFRLGEYLVAHGAPVSPRWDDAEKIADAPAGTPIGPLRGPRLVDRALDIARRQAAGIDRRTSRAALAIGSVALLLFAAVEPIGRLIAGDGPDRAALSRDLRQAGFSGTSVVTASDGSLTITGVVRDEDEMRRLRALAAQRGPGIIVDAQTGASLAAAATDLLQAQGISARVAPAQPGMLSVSAGYMPADRQDQLSGLIRRDMPAVRRVAFRIDDRLDASPLQSFFTRSGAGLATVVANPAHIVTADGSHWFPGATLPTGHRLLSVDATTVVFEKGGRTERITL